MWRLLGIGIKETMHELTFLICKPGGQLRSGQEKGGHAWGKRLLNALQRQVLQVRLRLSSP